MLEYQEEGFLPDALLNYLVRLGWSHGDQEFFTREEMIAAFDIRDINKAASAFNPEKLLWLNQQHMMKAQRTDARAASALAARAARHRTRATTRCSRASSWRSASARRRSRRWRRTAASSSGDVKLDAKAAEKHLTPEAPRCSPSCATRWRRCRMDCACHPRGLPRSLRRAGLGLGKVAQPLRVAVTGGTVSPPIDQTLALLGRDAGAGAASIAVTAAAIP